MSDCKLYLKDECSSQLIAKRVAKRRKADVAAENGRDQRGVCG